MSPRNLKLNEEMRAQSRAALIQAGRSLFGGQGYFNTTVAQVARQAGMSPGNVYLYFDSKEALLQAVLADGFEALGGALQEAASRPGSFEVRMGALVENVLAFGRQRWEFNQVLLSLMGHGGAPLLAGLGFDMDLIGRGYTLTLVSLLAEGQARGAIPTEHDPQVLAMLFFGLFNGLNLTYGRDWLDLPESVLHAAVRRLLGCCPQSVTLEGE